MWCLTGTAAAVHAGDFRVSLEAGATWQSRNDVRVPGDGGSRFAFDSLTGSGPYPLARVTADYDLGERHALRVVYAPLRIERRGVLAEPVEFAGGTFAAGAVRGTYQFDSPRLTYRYRLYDRGRWRLQTGVTLLVRDAEIALEQAGTRARRTDLGLVPLLHVAAGYRLGDRWQVALDFDGLAAPQGRALDLGVRAEYAVTDRWDLFAGYRTLDGGADNDEVFNFAWFNSAVIGGAYRF